MMTGPPVQMSQLRGRENRHANRSRPIPHNSNLRYRAEAVLLVVAAQAKFLGLLARGTGAAASAAPASRGFSSLLQLYELFFAERGRDATGIVRRRRQIIAVLFHQVSGVAILLVVSVTTRESAQTGHELYVQAQHDFFFFFSSFSRFFRLFWLKKFTQINEFLLHFFFFGLNNVAARKELLLLFFFECWILQQKRGSNKKRQKIIINKKKNTRFCKISKIFLTRNLKKSICTKSIIV